MTNPSVFLLGVSAIMMAGSIWFHICNCRTFKQRQELIDATLPGTPGFWDRMAIFDSVSYIAHLWALFFFRNPYALYKTPYHIVAMRDDATLTD